MMHFWELFGIKSEFKGRGGRCCWQ
jgi:hypothetical protein